MTELSRQLQVLDAQFSQLAEAARNLAVPLEQVIQAYSQSCRVTIENYLPTKPAVSGSCAYCGKRDCGCGAEDYQ